MDAPRAPLSPVERKVWHFLLDFLAEHTFQPSVREIARAFRIPSTKTVADLMASLEQKGYIRRAPGRSRGVILLGFAGGVGTQPVPIVRLGTTGTLQTEGHLTLDRAMLPGEDAFLIRAMIEEAPHHGVREGDLLLVHPTARASEGAPVVVRVGGAVLVRAIERRGGALILLAPRPGAEDLDVGAADDFAVLGPLAGVLRLPERPPDSNSDAR